MFLRKAQAGSSSTGHTWDADGQIVEVPDEAGAELLKIPHGGFSDAGGPDPFEDPEDDEDDEDDEFPVDPEVIEPDPAAKNAVTEPAPPADAAVVEKPVKAAAKKATAKNS